MRVAGAGLGRSGRSLGAIISREGGPVDGGAGKWWRQLLLYHACSLATSSPSQKRSGYDVLRLDGEQWAKAEEAVCGVRRYVDRVGRAPCSTQARFVV